MTKKLLIFIALITLASLTQAQVKFGLRAGITSSTLQMDEYLIGDDDPTVQSYVVRAAESRTGYQFGLVAQFSFVAFYVQPELLYSSLSGEVEVEQSGATYTETLTYNRLDIPIVGGYKFGPARLGIGPVASFMLKEESIFDNIDAENTEPQDVNKATWGFQVAAGVNVWKLGLDLKYEGSLSKLGDGVTLGNRTYDFDSRTRQWIFSVSYFF